MSLQSFVGKSFAVEITGPILPPRTGDVKEERENNLYVLPPLLIVCPGGDGMSGFDSAVKLLPSSLREGFSALPADVRDEVQEIRLRLGRHPGLTMVRGEQELIQLPPVGKEDLFRVLELATGASPYAAAGSIRAGYIHAGGGIRVGLCGRMRPGTEGTWAQSGLTSMCIRIPREIRGCGSPFCSSPFVSTLILSAPGAGKTTLLRDMVRLLSDRGNRVSLCDERGEVSALSDSGIGFDVGRCTDVLSEVPKGKGAMQLLRTMSPEILAMDEISDPEDLKACRAAAGCGAALLATAHAGGEEDWETKPFFRTISEDRIFRRLIWITVGAEGRRYREVRI